MNYQLILSQATRSDDYVEANKLGKPFGKRFDNWERLAESKAYLAALQQKYLTSDVRWVVQEKGKPTLIHPLVAIEYASWLSPELRVFANETFQRYVVGDISLAEEIVDRTSDNKKLDRLIERAEGKKVRNQFTDELKARGVEGKGYGTVSDATYRGMFGVSTKTLKAERGIAPKKSLRDTMSQIELAGTRLAELLAIEKMGAVDAQGTSKCASCAFQAADNVSKAIHTNRYEDIPVFHFN